MIKIRNGQNQAKNLSAKIFVHGPPTRYELRPKILPMKDLIKIYICGKFHHYSICGCKVKHFQSFFVLIKYP